MDGQDLYLPIGQRIRQARRRRGLSQDVFGGLVARSENWVAAVENGRLPVDRISVLIKVADVLRVSLSWLLQDIGYRTDDRPEVEGIQTLRRTLTMLPLRVSDQAPRPLPDLQADLMTVQHLRTEVRHADALAMLPHLLGDLHDAADGYEGETRRSAASLLVRGYEITGRTAGRYGETQLAYVAAERVLDAARRSGRPEDLVMASNCMALGLQGLGHLDEAIAVAQQGLQWSEADRDDPRVRALRGCTYLFPLSISYARRGDERRAAEALGEAEVVTREPIPADIRAWTMFGRTNLRIHQVEAAVDRGDPREALRLADQHGPEILTSGIGKSRKSRHLIDVALAHGHRRDNNGVVTTLLEIEQFAPEQLRNFALVPEMLHGALKRERGPRNEQLHALARRLKVA